VCAPTAMPGAVATNKTGMHAALALEFLIKQV